MSTTSHTSDVFRPLAAEAIGTLLLVAGVVGSGIMAQRLTHDVALQLLCNTLATGALLTVLILMFAPISGAQFNPAVTLALTLRGEIVVKRALRIVIAQLLGGVAERFSRISCSRCPFWRKARPFAPALHNGSQNWSPRRACC